MLNGDHVVENSEIRRRLDWVFTALGFMITAEAPLFSEIRRIKFIELRFNLRQ